MRPILIALYRNFLSRPELFAINTHIFKLHLRTLGLLNSETETATGEPWFLKKLSPHQPKVVVDVGANDSAYGQNELPNSYIFAFEPHPDSFKRLLRNRKNKVIPIEGAVTAKTGITHLWDFADSAPRKKDQPTSQLATVHQKIISDLYHQPSKKYTVSAITLDDYFKDKHIKQIDLLKIDAEGNELAVLNGCKQLLANNKIEIIQFEFNETHAYSHVLMKDFYDLLPNFSFYRLLPNGAVALGKYRPLTHELFGFQNIVAINQQSQYSHIFD